MVETELGNCSSAVSELYIAPLIIWLGGCFNLDSVYFSSNPFHGGLLTWRARTTKCCTSDSSENKTLPHCTAVQSLTFLVKYKHLKYIAEVRNGLWEGLCDFRPNSMLIRRETVIRLTHVPLCKQRCMYLIAWTCWRARGYLFNDVVISVVRYSLMSISSYVAKKYII